MSRLGGIDWFVAREKSLKVWSAGHSMKVSIDRRLVKTELVFLGMLVVQRIVKWLL
jgi:hypothetical protein